MENQSLAITSIPMQDFGKLYGEEEALWVGTVFEDLNLPFYVTGNAPGKAGKGDPLLQEIFAVSFFLDDLTLYLDTHETDQEALALYKEKEGKRTALLKEFAAKRYPLTRDCILYYQGEDKFSWQEGPMPWEGVYE